MIVSGIDAGSKVAKVVVLKDAKCIGWRISEAKGSDAGATENELLTKILCDQGINFSELGYVVSTGLNLNHLSYVNKHISESVALTEWAKTLTMRKITILNIGYQKVIAVKCAAGQLISSVNSDK